jgi:uncharacterized protein (UPF0332 family)
MLKDKSAMNLQAGEILAAAGLVDASASRYYYAMYQAAVHRLAALGLTPGRLESGAVQWSHAMVANNVLLVRKRRSDRDLYAALRTMRQRADYEADSVDPTRLASCVSAVRQFVEESTR